MASRIGKGRPREREILPGNPIRELRDKLRVTQVELARVAEVSPSYIAGLELGDVKSARGLCDALERAGILAPKQGLALEEAYARWFSEFEEAKKRELVERLRARVSEIDL